MVVGRDRTAGRRETAKGGEETLSENLRPVRQASSFAKATEDRQGRRMDALRECAQIKRLQCSLNSVASAADASRREP